MLDGRPLATSSGRPGSDEAEFDADPAEFPAPPVTTVPDPQEHNVQRDPREHNVWHDPRDHSVQKPPAGDYVTIPGVTAPRDEEAPADAIPIIPRLPALTPVDLPADSARFTPAPREPADTPDSPGPNTTRPPEATPLPADSAPQPTRHDAVPNEPDTPILPGKYALEPDPEALGAPHTPTRPHFDPHSLEYDPRDSGVPSVEGAPHLQPAAPPEPVERKRPAVRAQATMGEVPDNRP
ncbi:MAG: hypothetical protein ACRD0P_28855, partial [Stackebrandtia sp.]